MIGSGISSFRGTPSATDTSISLRLAVLDGRYPGEMLCVIGKNLADLMAFHRRHDIAVDEIKPLPRPASPPAPPCCWSPLRPWPAFYPHGDGTVTDNATGLMWQQEDDNNITRTWQQALAYCESLELPEGVTGWRLPNVKELESLTDDSRFNPAIDPAAFPDTNASNYWSSSTNANYPNSAWFVYFGSGYVYGTSKSSNYYVRCVRDGQ